MSEAHIAGFGIEVPFRVPTDRFLEVDAEMRRRHGQPEEVIELVARLVRGTGIRARHTIHRGWLEPDGPGDIFGPADFDPPLWERLAAWRDHAVPLAIEAARKALAQWGGSPDKITHILTTGTSGWIEPGVACAVIEALGLPLTCQKAELNFNGCFCGATCLRLARDLVRAEPGRVVLVVALEASSGHYDVVDTAASSLVANALFADGAAAMIIAEDGPWRFQDAGMHLVPHSKGMLTFEPPMRPHQVTYRMFLHREVGARIGAWFRETGSPLLERLQGPERAELAVHPGGPNILNALLEVLQEEGWPDSALERSFHTLHEYGNLGCAAVLFVLAETLPSVQGDRLGVFAFGPGVTVEWSSLRRS
jgi:predicted naringenin-chalcone synthase